MLPFGNKGEHMVILVDMDDVLEQLCAAWVEYLNRHFGTAAKLEDITDWDVTQAFPGLTREQVYSAELDDAFWDDVKPMPGAPEMLSRLMEEGNEVYIVTSSCYQTLRAKLDKVLFRYFPFLSWEQVIITSNKQMIRGDILIDDGPHNLAGGEYHKILFDAVHNRNFDESSIGAVRVKNWSEAYAAVRRYLSQA